MKTFAIIASGAAMSLVLGTAVLAQDAATVETPAATQAAQVAQPEAPAPPAETAPAQTSDAPQPAATAAASSATGRILFFRPSRLTGAPYTYHIVEVGDDGKAAKDAPRLGDLPNGGAFSFEAAPGIHSYNITGPMAVNKAEDRIRMEVEPGETYYVEQTVRMGIVTGGFRLVPADEARFNTSKVKLDKGKK